MTEEASVEEKFTVVQEYRRKMQQELVEALRQLSFLPQKWKEKGAEAKVGDFIMISRGRSKINPLGQVEFGVVEEILDEGRNLRIRVSRAHTKDTLVRQLVADSRNCYLIHREEEEKD